MGYGEISNWRWHSVTSKEVQEGLSVHWVRLGLSALDHQETNGQVEVIWRKLITITHSIMVHTRVSYEYIHFSLMYTTDHTFPAIPIKHLVNHDGGPTTPHKLETGTNPSVSNPWVLFCPCVVWKATAHVDTKALNLRHQSQKGFSGIFVEIPQHQKGYLVYAPSIQKIVSSHDVLFGKKIVCQHIRHIHIQRH